MDSASFALEELDTSRMFLVAKIKIRIHEKRPYLNLEQDACELTAEATCIWETNHSETLSNSF